MIPVPGWESSNITISWHPPAILANNHINEITYNINICHDNSCINYVNVNSMSYMIGGLRMEWNYTYTLITVRADGISGERISGTFHMSAVNGKKQFL